MKIAGIIPARYASTRFPGKPLADIRGKSMIRRVWEQCTKASCLDTVIVATDDERIADHVREFGEVVMTDPEHPSGTDRCREALEKNGNRFDYVINIQGDEPLMKPGMIDQLVAGMQESPAFVMGTLARPVESAEVWANPNVVKVVFRSEEHTSEL